MFSLWILRLRPQKFVPFWKLGCQPQKGKADKRFQSSDLFVFFIVPQRLGNAKRKISQITLNFGTICHTEVCLTFLRLAAKLSEMIANFRGCNLKLQRPIVIRLQQPKNGSAKIFKNYMKSLHFFQGLIYRIYNWGASKLIQIFLPDMCEFRGHGN